MGLASIRDLACRFLIADRRERWKSN